MACVALDRSDREWQEEQERFDDAWQPGNWEACDPCLRPARIWQIYKVQLDRPDYSAKKEEFESRTIRTKKGFCNERRLYHGTSLGCNFSGEPCHSTVCGVCGILSSGGKLLLEKVGARFPPIFGKGIYLTSGSHTAKGYGGEAKGGSERTGFERGDNGNALLVCDVLMGNVETHQRKGSTNPKPDTLNDQPLGEGCDSRLIEKMTRENRFSGNDEIVIFSEEQVKVKYIIIFDPDEHVGPTLLRDRRRGRDWPSQNLWRTAGMGPSLSSCAPGELIMPLETRPAPKPSHSWWAAICPSYCS